MFGAILMSKWWVFTTMKPRGEEVYVGNMFACQKTHSQKDDVLLFCFVTLNNGDNKHCMDWNCETSELLVVLPLL